MNPPSLQHLNELCFYVSGNVIIHPEACIASDVFLQADPNSQLIIGARTVIGPQSILHVPSGCLSIDCDVTIGTKVLVIGSGTIRENACIGSFSTLFSLIEINAHQVVPPRSLIGDTSRVVHLDELSEEDHHDVSFSATSTEQSFTASTSTQSEPSSPPQTQSANHTMKQTVVYGRASVEKLIQVMFPTKRIETTGSQNTDPSNGAGQS
ncbi:MAG: hypothetical protein AAFU78_02170 [Cyanobacteria bacterium J06633_2]